MIWFKVQTIKYANENMNITEKATTDEMIMVALILLYFNASYIPRLHGSKSLLTLL